MLDRDRSLLQLCVPPAWEGAPSSVSSAPEAQAGTWQSSDIPLAKGQVLKHSRYRPMDRNHLCPEAGGRLLGFTAH